MAKISKWEKKAKNATRSVLTSLIRNISIIAIFIVLVIVTIASLGATFDLAGALAVGLGVASVLLLIGTLILYELWLRNGQDDGKEEPEFITAKDKFLEQSKNIHNQTMQDFIEWEKARRYAVEQHRINKELENLRERLQKIPAGDKKIKALLAKEKRLMHYEIEVDMPYVLAEQFDEMKYSVNDTQAKEYKPNSAKLALKHKRIIKYAASSILSLFSVNLILLGSISWSWQVLFVFLMAVVAVVIAIVSGFSTGYNVIMKTTLGMYNTANDFIDKAKAWCDIKQVSLYYKEKEFEFSAFALDNENLYKPSLEDAFAEPYISDFKDKKEIIIE